MIVIQMQAYTTPLLEQTVYAGIFFFFRFN